jgi:AcrR family transcriptional regulator
LTVAVQPPRKRDAEATKQAILDAAAICFSKAAYDQVGVREIAALAGVDPALVGRYFGSKDELFGEWVRQAPQPPPSYPDDRREFGEWMARQFLSKDRVVTRLLVLHHSVTNPRAAKVIRKLLNEHVIKPLGKWIGGKDGELRAGLILAHLTGLGVMRDIVRVDALAEADRERLVKRLAPALQTYVDD